MPCHWPTNARVIFSLTRAVPLEAMEIVSWKSATRQLLGWARAVAAKARSENRSENSANSRRLVDAPRNILRISPRLVRGQRLLFQRTVSAGSRTSRPEYWLGKIESWYSDRARRHCSSVERFESHLRSR